MASRRDPINLQSDVRPRDPETWGGPDPLPGGKTRRLLMPVWERMLRSKDYPWFTAEMKQAGDEIERVFSAITAGLMPRSQMGALVSGMGGGSDTPLSQGLVIAYRDRYKPWADEMSAYRVKTGNPVMAFIIDICSKDFTIRECERHHRLGNGRGPELIRFGLGRYVEISGWVRRRNVPPMPTTSWVVSQFEGPAHE